ncbi:hypothetical protein [Macrococcoides caseolyticum]|uniref:hypothetical protein n=1 Tax=Macrococcoides caseolyticum TaxID=69966 RepID=UPI001C5F0E88|nr:hypothetical protein [Macrococcus caseolyticus]QYA36574.1 hypothetical protein KYI08_12115 [Macrococcus caseolyticus]
MKEIEKISLNIDKELKEDLDYLKDISTSYTTRNSLIIAILETYRDQVFEYLKKE